MNFPKKLKAKPTILVATVLLMVGLSAPPVVYACYNDRPIWDAATGVALGGVTGWLTAVKYVKLQLASAAEVIAEEISVKSKIQAAADIKDGVYIAQGDRMIIERSQEESQRYQLPPAPCLTMRTATLSTGVDAEFDKKSGVLLSGITKNRMTTSNSGDSGLLRDYKEASRYMKNGDIVLNDGTFLDADITALTLIGKAGTTFNQKQEEAALAYIRNATQTQPLPMLNARQAETDDGRKYIAMQRAEAAAISIPQYSFTNQLSLKSGKDAFFTSEVERRFSNPAWLNELASKPPEAAAKEKPVMGAFYAKLQHMEIESLDRIELLLAQININNIASSSTHQEALNQYSSVSAKSK